MSNNVLFHTTNSYTLTREDGSRFREEFAHNCCVKFPSFFAKDSLNLLKDEALKLFQKHSRRRDFNRKEGKGIIRHFSAVSGDIILAESNIIPVLYESPQLIDFLSGVASTQVYLTPDIFDRHVIHKLEKKGDIHGGHLDTYAFVFAIFIEAPPEGTGGYLEFVPYSTEVRELDTPKAKRVPHNVGDCYFLRTDKAVHRVSPLEEETQRCNIVFSYADEKTKDIKMAFGTQLIYT